MHFYFAGMRHGWAAALLALVMLAGSAPLLELQWLNPMVRPTIYEPRLGLDMFSNVTVAQPTPCFGHAVDNSSMPQSYYFEVQIFTAPYFYREFVMPPHCPGCMLHGINLQELLIKVFAPTCVKEEGPMWLAVNELQPNRSSDDVAEVGGLLYRTASWLYLEQEIEFTCSPDRGADVHFPAASMDMDVYFPAMRVD